MPPYQHIPILLAASVLLGCAGARADDRGVKWFEAADSRAWLVDYDPTLIGRRVYSKSSFEDDRGGDYTMEVDNSVRYAFSPVKDVALGAQFALPVKWGSNSGTYAAGLSAFEWRAGAVLRLNERLRWGGGMNLKVPTSVGAQLENPFTELRPLTALSWSATDRLNLTMIASYYLTPEDTGPGGTNKLELEWPVACQLTRLWSAAVTYKPAFRFSPSKTTHRLQVGATYLFGRNLEFAVSPAFEVPLGRQDLEWKSYLALAWSF